MAGKTKVSVTIAKELLAEVDRVSKDRTRSAVFEDALSSWVRRRRVEALHDDFEKYYRGMSEAERREDAEWARLGGRAIATWDDE